MMERAGSKILVDIGRHVAGPVEVPNLHRLGLALHDDGAAVREAEAGIEIRVVLQQPGATCTREVVSYS